MKIFVTLTARTVNLKIEERFLFWPSAKRRAKLWLNRGFDTVRIERGKRKEDYVKKREDYV